MGLEIYFYVSVKCGLHESRSISGYWLRTRVHGRDMLSLGAASTARICRATTVLLSFSSAHILETPMYVPSLLRCCSAQPTDTSFSARPFSTCLNKAAPSGRSLPVSPVPVPPPKAAAVTVRVPCRSPGQPTSPPTSPPVSLCTQSCRSGGSWACVCVCRWMFHGEGLREEGPKVLGLHLSTPLPQQHCGAVLWHGSIPAFPPRVLDVGGWREAVMQHRDLRSVLQPFLANALCCRPASSSQFWRLAQDQVQSSLNSNQTWEMHWPGSQAGPVAPSSSSV